MNADTLHERVGARRLARAVSVRDVRRRARRTMPRAVFDFVDGAAEDEVTAGANERDFSEVTFRSRVLVDTSSIDTTTSICGTGLALPLLLAPTGLVGLAAADGEVKAARAAASAGAGFVLSSASSCPMEDVAASAGPSPWFQLYPWRDRDVTGALMDRASSSGYHALCVTVDVPVVASRDRDRRNGFTIPPRFSPSTALDFARHPFWSMRMLREPPAFANLEALDIVPDGSVYSIATFVNEELVNPATDWAELGWIRDQWAGPMFVKGVMTGDDARRAEEIGADGVVVSNHGGRQLDGLPSTLQALPEVVDAVGDRSCVLMDGGVRRGSDVIKALALGARGCLIGRPFWYGLSVAGEAGVRHVIRLYHEEMIRTLQLLGCPSIAELDRTYLSAWAATSAHGRYRR